MSDGTAGAVTRAKLIVVGLGVVWGFNWIAGRLILDYFPPWTLRTTGIGLGALTLFAAALIGGVPLAIPPRDRPKVMLSGFLNVAAFCALSAYAQVYGTTSRAVVIAYSMPIWSVLLAWLVLKEKLSALKLMSLALCAVGLVVLIYPLARDGFPLGALLALASAWVWALGTIYQKTADIRAPTLAVTAWQLLFGWLVLLAGMLSFEGMPKVWPLPGIVVASIAYNGVLGLGVAYFLWYVAIARLPAMTASLGSLLVPVVGVIASALILGEHPSLTDGIGFALIFAAAASVLLQPSVKHTEMPEIPE